MLEFTPDEIATLRALLGKIAENGGYWPDEETMRIAHGAISYWACELVLLRDGKNGLEILLAEYSDGVEAFLGMWHIPGGYNKVLEKDTQETCSRVAQREIGVDVDYCETLDSYKWAPGEHPYGRPLSVYVGCIPLGEIAETKKLRFFSVNALPENVVGAHRQFILNNLR